MTTRLAIGIGMLGLVALGCDARTMIGELPGSVSSTIGTGGSGTCTPPSDPKDQAFTPPAGVAGTWTGYYQGSNLPIGADAVKLTIDQASDGSNQIHVVFGSSPPPPPATDAKDFYPPGAFTSIGNPLEYIEGFSYPGHEVQWLGQRLKFGVAAREAWNSWCLLQESYSTTYLDQTSYSCTPGSGGGSDLNADGGYECYGFIDSHGTKTPVDCEQQAMCFSGYCQCDECGCSAPVGSGPNFDLTFDGDLATGTGISGYLRLMRTAS
jgi:hypothetical protein